MTNNKTPLQECINRVIDYQKWRRGDDTLTQPHPVELGADLDELIKTAQAYEYVVHENEHLKACLKADNDIQNRIIKLAEPFMNIQNGKTYCAYHALDTVENIVKAYADLPDKIEGLDQFMPYDDFEKPAVFVDDILNLLKETKNEK